MCVCVCVCVCFVAVFCVCLGLYVCLLLFVCFLFCFCLGGGGKLLSCPFVSPSAHDAVILPLYLEISLIVIHQNAVVRYLL